MERMLVKLVRAGATLPLRATEGSAGYDLCAMVVVPTRVEQGQVATIPTGIAIQLEPGYAALVMGRSGLGIKHGVAPANAVGLIDSDYRGEIAVGLTCHRAEGYTVQPGERIAQLVVIAVATPALEAADSLEDTHRGSGGFGSSGRQ